MTSVFNVYKKDQASVAFSQPLCYGIDSLTWDSLHQKAHQTNGKKSWAF